MGYKGESKIVTLHLNVYEKVVGVTKAQVWVVQKVDNATCMH